MTGGYRTERLKLRRNLLLLLTGMNGYCADLNNRIPTREGPDAQEFLEDIATISEEIHETQQLIKKELSGVDRRLSADEYKHIEYELRNSLDVIVQSCEMAKTNAPLFHADREVIEMTRAVRYFLHLLEQQLAKLHFHTSQPASIEEVEKVHPLSRLITLTGDLLIVTDQQCTKQLRQPLTAAGHHPAFANDSAQASTLLATHCFDLILLDATLGDSLCVDLLRTIRQWYSINELPVIILRATRNTEQKILEIQSGANDHADLPLEIPLLLAQIRRQLTERSLSEHAGVLNMFIRSTLASYLTYEIVDRLLDTPQGLGMSGEKRMVTILFSDLRDFTAMSERLGASAVVQLLNIYLSTMIGIISEFGGIINEVMGDGLLILFGAPIERDDDAERAVACAIAMQMAMASVNEQSELKKLPPLEMGIGINTGEVVAGNIGSVLRTKYSVVGLHVNLAARVESQTVGGQILITEATLNAIMPRCHINGRSKIKAKGIDAPVTIYDIGGIEGQYRSMLPQKEGKLFPLTHPLPISFKILQNKKITHQVISGKLTSMSTSGKKAQVQTHSVPKVMSNILFHVGASSIHMDAKVTQAAKNAFDMTITNLSDRNTLCRLMESNKC